MDQLEQYSRLPTPPTGEWSFQVLHREVWTRVLGTGRGRTAHERLEGVIDRGLQNRTDAEEAARRETPTGCGPALVRS